MKLRKTIYISLAVLLLLISTAVSAYFYLKPNSRERVEIYKGVYLTVDKISKGTDGSGVFMMVEVHWDTPGVRIENRRFDYLVDPTDSDSPHYKLEFADIALAKTGAAVLMNSCLYHPGEITKSLPGRPVRALETIIVNGAVSHVHQHSYLLYWDASMDARILQTKPPDRESLENAVVGLSIQGVQVSDGKANLNALGNKDVVHPRTFIGIDPDRRVLYLLAFENASGYLMMERAVREGVVFGGQLDSGDSTNLIIGKNAKGVSAHTGIRNFRPLGPYIMIFADPI